MLLPRTRTRVCVCVRTYVQELDERLFVPYEIGRQIGTGHWSVVRAARHVLTGEMVAIKIVDKQKLDEEAVNDLIYETLCMKLVQHP